MSELKNKELTVQGNGEFNIVMEYDQSDLDEVVVIGYGTATKKDLTGAVARFDSKIIEESYCNEYCPYDAGTGGRFEYPEWRRFAG